MNVGWYGGLLAGMIACHLAVMNDSMQACMKAVFTVKKLLSTA
jgi:NAD(P)H-hydrate repair Nnr-like enzyme with NAD(P)H-hydrate dehydratase domain